MIFFVGFSAPPEPLDPALPMTHSGQAPAQETPQAAPPVHEATALTQGGTLAHIRLNDQTYALRITRAGKLILTK